MEWSREKCLTLIDEYQKHQLLWDPKDLNHFHKIKKSDAWEAIAFVLKTSVLEVRNKMCSLLASFRREKAKMKQSLGTGKGADEVYVSKWFAFDGMRFLLDKDDPVGTLNTDNLSSQHDKSGGTDELSQQPIEDESGELIDVENMDSQTSTQPSAGDTTTASSGRKRMDRATTSRKNKKRKSADEDEDPRIGLAFSYLEKSVQRSNPAEDENAVYGIYVASKLRQYSKTTRLAAEHAINGILYQADRGYFENPPYRSSEGQLFENHRNLYPERNPQIHQNINN